MNKPIIKVVETVSINDPNYIQITWDDLPGFILEFPYQCIIPERIWNIQKKDTLLMAMSKMTGIYKHKKYGYILTDLTRPNVPRLYWKYNIKWDENTRIIYNYMMEILRMTIILRLNQIPKL
jgi:hypothetical protein